MAPANPIHRPQPLSNDPEGSVKSFGLEKLLGGSAGNMENDGKNHGSTKKPMQENQKSINQNSQLPKEATGPINDKKRQHTQQEFVIKTSKSESGPRRPQKLSQKSTRRMMSLEKQPTSKQDILDDAALDTELEKAKRKLQERYQQAENAKKHRATKFLDISELPEQNLGGGSLNLKGNNCFRHSRK